MVGGGVGAPGGGSVVIEEPGTPSAPREPTAPESVRASGRAAQRWTPERREQEPPAERGRPTAVRPGTGDRGRRPGPGRQPRGTKSKNPSGLTTGEVGGCPAPSFFPTPPPIGCRECRPSLRASRLPPQTANRAVWVPALTSSRRSARRGYRWAAPLGKKEENDRPAWSPSKKRTATRRETPRDGGPAGSGHPPAGPRRLGF